MKNINVFSRIYKLVIFALFITFAQTSSSFSSDFFPIEILNKDLDIGIRAGMGYRVDDLEWNIGNPDDSIEIPNIYSELQFNDMNIWYTSLDVTICLQEMYARTSIIYGQIIDGVVTDSDYSENNRNGLNSKSVSKIENDNVKDISSGIGYRVRAYNDRLTIIPIAGISYHKQQIRFIDGYEIVPEVGPIHSELNSTYNALWKSWWLGIDVSFPLATQFFLFLSFEDHFAEYEAEASWNLRTEFAQPVSFTHRADGEGQVYNIEGKYIVTKNIDASIKFALQKWETDKGEDRVYWSSGGSSTTQLNEVKWDTRSIQFTMSVGF